ncbi:MAG: endonuclease/exonuclease/phosphatase family protein [Polyangiaceae bacterium]
MNLVAPSNLVRALLGLALAVATSSCAVHVVPDGTLRHVEGAAVAALDPTRVRVLVWNVYKASLPGWWEDFAPLVAEHDVALLQEGWWTPDTEPRWAGVGFDWWMGVTFESPWSDSDPATGTVVGARAPLRAVVSRHSRYLEPVLGTPKSHCFGRVPLAGRDDELLVVSVHGINFRLGLTAFSDQLRLVMQDAANHRGPAIVAGDFNTWSEERTDALFVAMERARFSSPYPRSASTAPPDGRTRSGDHYLDHAFVRGLDVTDATVLTTIESSDHQALSFAVRVPPEKRFTLDARGSLSSSR